MRESNKGWNLRETGCAKLIEAPRLNEIDFRQSYHKPEDDIAQDFYLPAMKAAKSYDRAVGFFSSSIYIISWPSIKFFARNGGKIRMICSPVLSAQDDEALRIGYTERDEERSSKEICQRFDELLASDEFAKPAKILASLVSLGILEVKLAWVGQEASARSRRLFHDKLGILSDGENRVAFKGSMNETWPGLALDGNLESIDVFTSWSNSSDRTRIATEAEYFERLWLNESPHVTVLPVPKSAKEHIISRAEVERWPEYVDEINLELETAAGWSPEAGKPGGRKPRKHQVTALENWLQSERRGILKHATGSGKTFTALCAINDAIGRRDTPIILVPSDLLLSQWDEELRTAFAGRDLQILVCGGGNSQWRSGSPTNLKIWSRPLRPGQAPRIILSTLQTACSESFLSQCHQGEHLFLVADEVHRLGAQKSRRVLDLKVGARLGLSATPERVGDPDGTSAILEYFGGIVRPVFGIADALRAKTLTPYAYHIHKVQLLPEEQERWDELSARYRKAYARYLSGGYSDETHAENTLKRLLIQRSKVVKGAHAKIALAARVVAQKFEQGQHWIVYCDDQDQLYQVLGSLRDAGLRDVYEYHSEMKGDRKATLRGFSALGGVVVSIKCLDEGVDIPNVSHALILASSKNPREFIQRRGRVLRKSEGKYLAHVHDAIVIPSEEHEDDTNSIIRAELARAIEFGQYAVNPASVSDLEMIAIELGVDLGEAGQGLEDDEGNGL
ncbi:DEAD/DEAH box helicase family protein [Altererythrobacter sp. GH1-8]|uniref:DEAD/DEAH box helicase family protein n=1 Tax=Altererythrobacter sp. GH1-8 TaxID=3349333 RepID=UPI00374DF3FB